MNAVATIPTTAVALAMPDDMVIDQWWELGEDLFARRRSLDWMLADWVAAGVERFPEQIEFALVGGKLGVEPKMLQAAAKTASAFPASQRDEALTIEHHIHVADLPTEERLSLLKQAHEGHWTPKRTRVEAIKRKVAIGQSAIFTDDDFEHHELMAITRAWNRARPSVRRTFMDLVAEAGEGDIDA